MILVAVTGGALLALLDAEAPAHRLYHLLVGSTS